RLAAAQFGDLHEARLELVAVDRRRRRRRRLAGAFDAMGQDLRHAARSLRRSPAFTGAAIATLTIGIGAATAVLAVVRAALRRAPRSATARCCGLCRTAARADWWLRGTTCPRSTSPTCRRRRRPT